MFNTEIVYKANGSPDMPNIEEVEKTTCLICGKEITEGISSKKVLSGNFTNWGECKSKTSTHVCRECAFCMKENSLRKNNFVADKKNIYLLKKNDLENYLFNLERYVTGEFVVGVTQSFKKHNSFRCRVNNSTKCFYIREEDREYLFDTTKLKKVYDLLNEAYLQFSKDELKTGHYKLISIEQFGIEKFEQFESVFKQYRGSAQFDLLIYILNSEKRNEFIKEKMRLEKEEKAKLKALEKEKKKLDKNKTIKKKKMKGN